jgi:acyl carrier protein
VDANGKRQVLATLTDYISREALEGRDEGLQPTSPLLAWGIINSLEITRLVAFIRQQFGVAVPGDRMIADHFKDLESIAALVIELEAAQ